MSERKGRYTTPPGVDERIVTDIPHEVREQLNKMHAGYINWNKFKIIEGGGAKQFSALYLNQVQTKRTKEESIIIIVTAKPGSGKSYHVLRFAQILDPKFDVDLQVVFTRPQFLYLVSDDSPLVRGQVIMCDEAHFGMGARNWYEQVQKMLMNNIVALRSKGLIIVIVALHLEQMDKIIRQYVLSYMHHMERRGLATLYSLYTMRFDPDLKKSRLGQLELQLPDIEKCTHISCLSCEYSGVVQKHWKQRDKWDEMGYKPCLSIRAKYERNKKQFISNETAKAQAAVRAQELRENPLSHDEYAEILMGAPDGLSFTNRGNPSHVSIMTILKDLGYPIKSTVASHVQAVLMDRYLDEMRRFHEDWKKQKNS